MSNRRVVWAFVETRSGTLGALVLPPTCFATKLGVPLRVSVFLIIARSTDGTTFSEYDDVDGSTTTYQDTGASDGTTYYYEVYAANAVGNSANTSSASASTPLAPPTDLTAGAVSDTEIDLSWSNVSTAASGISISRSTDNVNFGPPVTLAATATTYTDDDASPGTTYYYQVMATQGSATSTAAAANAQTMPANLTTLTATANAPGTTSSVSLSWTPVTGAAGYEIDRQDSSGNWQEYDAVESGTATGYTDTGVQDGTAYTYRVLPYNDSGTSDDSSAPTASATTPLIAPANVTAVALSSTSVEIVWDNQSSSETGFSVQRILSDGNDGAAVTVPAGTTDYVDSDGVVAGETYLYQVSATKGTAASPVAESNQVTTPSASVSDAGPAAATLSVETALSTEIDLTVAAPTDGSRLELEQQGPNDDNFGVVDITPTSSDGTLTYAVTGLAPSTYYTFRLRADLNGLESYSPIVGTETQDTSATVDPSLPVPYDLTVTPDNNSDRLEYGFQWQQGSISVSDTDSAFDVQYQLLNPTDPHDVYKFSAEAGYGGNGTGGASLAPLYNGIGYYEAQVRVRFNDGGAVSAYSDWVTGTVSRPQLQAPQNFSVADAGNGQLTATWDPVNDPNYPSSQYNIEYRCGRWIPKTPNRRSNFGMPVRPPTPSRHPLTPPNIFWWLSRATPNRPTRTTPTPRARRRRPPRRRTSPPRPTVMAPARAFACYGTTHPITSWAL